jgi:hypothetical protein
VHSLYPPDLPAYLSFQKVSQPDCILCLCHQPVVPIISVVGAYKVTTTWEWVKGHAAERKGKKICSLPDRLNYQADRLAKNALLLAIAGGSIISGDFPFESVKFKLKDTRVSGSFRHSLEADWGYPTAQTLFVAMIITYWLP